MAAGLGFKTFNTGDVLSAADTNGYLMQGIWVFANAAARDAAVTSPQEGNACYLKDTDAVQTYSGAAWVAVGGGAAASWTSFTPAFTNLTVGNATLVAKYININKTVFFNVQVTFGSTTSMGTAATLTLPVTAASAIASQGGIYQITFQDAGIGTFVGTLQALNNSATTLRFGGIDTGSTYATYVQTTSSVPCSWGTGDGIYISGMYEVA
jgi:hypothetical protein